VQVQIEDAFAASVSPEWLSAVAQTTLQAEGHSAGALTLVVTYDDKLQALNLDYLNVDAPTDVLSFGGEAPDFVAPPGTEAYWGDVMIAYAQAKAQASAAGHRIEEELALLVVHGVLHLLGYDHVHPEDKKLMWQRQAEILSRLGLAHIQPE
jgi:probable rRNA maturation factor